MEVCFSFYEKFEKFFYYLKKRNIGGRDFILSAISYLNLVLW